MWKKESNPCSTSIFPVFKTVCIKQICLSMIYDFNGYLDCNHETDLFNIDNCILFGGLNVCISHCFQYIGTIKPACGWRWQTAWTLYIVIHCVQKKKLAVSEGGCLSGGGLTGDYCTGKKIDLSMIFINFFTFFRWLLLMCLLLLRKLDLRMRQSSKL